MAYSLKSVQYKGKQHKILLQNENGPCPLIACANALLLSTKITLPQSSIRNNVISIDEVVNMLAGHALKRKSQEGGIEVSLSSVKDGHNNNMEKEEGDAAAAEHHIDELLKLFPSLQHGMDVNPKFTLGPTGCEYNTGLGAFDIMGVDLVHGWLVDVNQEREVAEVIGNKSYNELVEMVIKGNEAADVVEQVMKKMKELYSDGGNSDDCDDQNDGSTLSEEEKGKQLDSLQEELHRQNHMAAQGDIVKQFLDETSHQLTYNGLMELHSHVIEGQLCVFFRNNHFATITKHEGILYLLVTDLGYAGVNDVVWEKLDDISGDTDLYDASFCKTKAQDMQPVATGPNFEQLLSQRGQTDADFQLALELSRNDQRNTNRLAQQEGDLIAAATELSLRTYNSQDDPDAANDNASELLAHQMQMKINEERDREVAARLQAELNRAETRNVNQRPVPAAQQPPRRPAPKQSDSSGCCIS